MDPDQPAGPFAALDATIDRVRGTLAAGRPQDTRTELRGALDTLRTMPATAGCRRRRARALGLLAMIEFESDGTERALARLDEAAAEADGAEDLEVVALTWSLRATVLGRSGRTIESLAALDCASEHRDAMQPRDQTILLMNRGVARSLTGDLTGAVADLGQAAALASRAGLPHEQFMATHNLGYLHHLRGDVPSALRAMEEADRLDVEVSRGVSLLDRGRVLVEAGLADEAAAVLERSIELCRADGQQQAEAEAEYEQSRTALLRGRPEESLARIRTARTRFDERTSGAWVIRCRMAELRLRLLEAHLAGATPGDAVTLLARDAGQLLDDLERQVAAVVVRAARVLAAEAAALAGDPEHATSLLPETDDALAPLLTARLDTHRARATIAMARGQADHARRRLAAAAAELSTSALSATTLDLRTARMAHVAVLAHLDLSLHLDEGPLAAIGAVDRWRASTSRLPPVRPHADEATTALLAARRQLRETLRDAPTQDGRRWDELTRLEHEIATRRRTAAAARPMAGTAPHGDGAVAAVSADTLLAALAADERDLLVTVAHGGEVLAFGIEDGVPWQRAVGEVGAVSSLARQIRADLRTLATTTAGPVHAAVRASLRDGAATLRERLFGRAAAHGDRRLLTVVHGDLAGVPWGIVTPGRPVVQSASTSAWVHDQHPTAAATSAVGVMPTSDAVRVIRGPRLAAATHEVEAVADAWGIDPTCQDATAAQLVEALEHSRLVHVVAHGRHHRQQPLFSSVALHDGPCCLYDVEPTGVGAQLVVLASCDAGSATIRPGDEPLGLAAGLLALGARSVVAPICPVPDQELPQVMGRFHRALAAGAPSDEALLSSSSGTFSAIDAFVVAGAAVRLAEA